jgi:RNA polymerase sigma-70 factor (ECF subfamily)
MGPDRTAASRDLDRAVAAFGTVRPRLFGIAYRILGSATEAEDVVQECWLRWQAQDRGQVRDPPAFLATIATRLAINVAASARARHETYIGPWLPEPVDTSTDPGLGAERGEALELAVLLLLQALSAVGRAAFVLREAFDYRYAEIAELLEIEEANARQLVARARRHVAEGRRADVGRDEQRRLLEAFLLAARAGDLEGLESLLAEDAVSLSDGGGAAQAARRPVVGRPAVARFVAAFSSHFWTGAEIVPVDVNGAPGVLVSRGGAPVAVLALTASDRGVDQLLWAMNPVKIARIAASAGGAGRSAGA